MSTRSNILAVITLLTLSPAALASVPADTSFQGRLLDASGVPLAGPVDLEVGIWTALVGGERVYRETHTAVPLDDGVFHVLLGTGATDPGETPFPEVFVAHADLYLEVSVEGETLAPRQAIGSAPYAFKAETSAAFQALSAELCRLFIKLGEELPPGCPALKRVFVTSTRYTGDLGGIPGADEKCQSHADAAGLAGTFLAWISDGVDSPATRFARSAEPYVRTDGTKIAEDWDDLVDELPLSIH